MEKKKVFWLTVRLLISMAWFFYWLPKVNELKDGEGFYFGLESCVLHTFLIASYFIQFGIKI